MYNKQKAENLLEIYNDAQEKGLSGAETEVYFQYSGNKFYFTDGGMEYSITIKDLASGLEGGFSAANEIKAWAAAKYD